MLVEVLVLVVASLLFLVSMAAIIIMVKEFAQLKSAVTLMEAAFKDNHDMMVGVNEFVGRGFEGINVEYTNLQKILDKLLESNASIQERLNNLEHGGRKGVLSDTTFN